MRLYSFVVILSALGWMVALRGSEKQPDAESKSSVASGGAGVRDRAIVHHKAYVLKSLDALPDICARIVTRINGQEIETLPPLQGRKWLWIDSFGLGYAVELLHQMSRDNIAKVPWPLVEVHAGHVRGGPDVLAMQGSVEPCSEQKLRIAYGMTIRELKMGWRAADIEQCKNMIVMYPKETWSAYVAHRDTMHDETRNLIRWLAARHGLLHDPNRRMVGAIACDRGWRVHDSSGSASEVRAQVCILVLKKDVERVARILPLDCFAKTIEHKSAWEQWAATKAAAGK